MRTVHPSHAARNHERREARRGAGAGADQRGATSRRVSRQRGAWCALALLAACGTPGPAPDGGTPVDAGFVPTHRRLLGLNDVTFLLPLEPLTADSPFAPASSLLPLQLFNRLTEANPRVTTELNRLRVVAVRFDLCDRIEAVPCVEGAEASLRLVLQPLFGTPIQVEDVTFHAFFPIPAADVPELVDTLRGLAEHRGVARGSALAVATSFTSDATFRSTLGALVGRYARSQRLLRLTLFGQETERAALVWIFRGEELQQGVLGPITIPGIAMPSQEVLLFGGDSYQVTPVADVPAGFARVVMETSFRNSSDAQKLESVRAMLAVDNPTLHTANTVQCMSCHVTTTLVPPRTADAGIDATTLAERFTASVFDLTALGDSRRARTLRALGYFGSNPLVSQRVVNETAHVLRELEARFPPPP